MVRVAYVRYRSPYIDALELREDLVEVEQEVNQVLRGLQGRQPRVRASLAEHAPVSTRAVDRWTAHMSILSRVVDRLSTISLRSKLCGFDAH